MAKHSIEDIDSSDMEPWTRYFRSLSFLKQWDQEYQKTIPVGRVEFRPTPAHLVLEF